MFFRWRRRVINFPPTTYELAESLDQLKEGQKQIMATLDDIKAAVEAERTVEQSVITLLGELKGKLDAAIANGADPAELQAIADELASNTQALSDAVTANTPNA